MKLNKIPSFLVLIIILCAAATYIFYTQVVNVAVPYEVTKGTTPVDTRGREVVYIGVISRYPPNVIMHGYQPIMDYLNSVTPYQFELKLSTNYEQTLHQLINGEVTAAFFGSFLYVKSKQQYNLLPLLKPLNESGEPYFRSALIAPENSHINTIHDLQGKKLALPSPESFSGNWLINYEMPKNKIAPGTLKEVQHFAHHHSVVYQVLKGTFDAGVVRDYLARQYLNRGIKIVAYSEAIPGSPIVISPISKALYVEALKKALLALNPAEAKYSSIMQQWDKEFIHGFVVARDTDYNVIRNITGKEPQKR